ncbi:MAG: hypothetical protein DRR15_17605 [Gammaproteobacteria bacterium]|nr:MAG: hypothetical protein DRR15_17605 [Gammaproteobacteria bacterium]
MAHQAQDWLSGITPVGGLAYSKARPTYNQYVSFAEDLRMRIFGGATREDVEAAVANFANIVDYINFPLNNGKTLMHNVLLGFRADFATVFVKYGASLDMQYDGAPVLFDLVASFDDELPKNKLYGIEVDLHARSSAGWNAVGIAAANNSVNWLKYLVKRGVRVKDAVPEFTENNLRAHADIEHAVKALKMLHGSGAPNDIARLGQQLAQLQAQLAALERRVQSKRNQIEDAVYIDARAAKLNETGHRVYAW